MIEILVTLFIIAAALLGTVGLQIYAMKMNQGGQFRSQAVFLSADIAERMEANKIAAVAGQYQVAAGAATVMTTDCAAAACDSNALAAFDLNQWQDAITALLPQGSWEIQLTAAGNPATYTIVVSWVDRRTGTQYATAGTGETFSYTTTKTVYQ
jgi:type IV pilus assembly protein PilV